MGGLAFAAAVDHSLAATALLELYLSGRPVKLAMLASGVGAAYELPGKLHIHPVIQIQCELRHSQASVEAELDEEVDERAFTDRYGAFDASVHSEPRAKVVSYYI